MNTRNNFDLMRLSAAGAVLASHSVSLAYGPGVPDLVSRLTKGQASLGELAVTVFFVISGYLITKSYVERPDPVRFVLARSLRLLPGLLTALCVLALVMGPLLTDLTWADYFADPRTARFLWVNGSLAGFAGELPGVFARNPFRGTVDGSLWTLEYEAICYLGVLAFGLARCLTRPVAAGAWVAALAASFLWFGGPMIPFASFFLGGSVMYLWSPRLTHMRAAACAVVWAASAATGGLRLASATVGAYVIVYVAQRVRPAPVKLRGDYSYGIYLWAFPVQQVAASALGGAASWQLVTLISAPVVCGLAWLSWNGVEAPCLGLLRRSPLAVAARSMSL